jgi:hypothetical protein
VKKFDEIFFGLIIGGIFPVLFVLVSFLCWYYLDRNETRVLIFLAAGLLAGLIINVNYLKT